MTGASAQAAGSRLALGTAQIGAGYGVTRRDERALTLDRAESILSAAARLGISQIDTAPGYGDAEVVLGAIGVRGWSVTTKVPGLMPGEPDPSGSIRRSVERSLERLRLERLDGLLLHRPSDLLGRAGPTVAATLVSLRDEGITRRIGVSVYSPEELHAALGRLPIDTVQAPVSAVDRRFLAESLWARIADGAIELEARSVLLQGVLSSRERPLQFQPWQVQLEAWDDFVMDHGGDHTAVAVAVVLGSTRVARIVVGAEAPTQLRSWARAGDITIDPGDRFGCADEDLIDPRRWRPWE